MAINFNRDSVFNLKPISENDTELIKSWMAFYKKCYFIIAFIIFVIKFLKYQIL